MFLGIDLSTQSISAVVTRSDDARKVVATHALRLDDLGFATNNGVLARDDGSVVAPSRMFVAALDHLLEGLREKVDLATITAVSGCGQQHGSVFWRKGADETLRKLDPSQSLAVQLKDGFAIENGPIWMDSSSTPWCLRLEDHAGGPATLATLTGSRAYERFTGNQIAKLIDMTPDFPIKVGRISLVSSLLSCLFIGDYAGIDDSDATGMNLLNIHSREWVLQCLSSVAGENLHHDALREMLGTPVVPYLPLGPIAPYFVKRYGFNPACRVVPFTGDNPSTLAGLGISSPGDLAVSLGTSDTAFAVVSKAECKPSGEEGHVLINPVDPDTFIVMLCFKNGSLAREHIRSTYVQGTWSNFNETLATTSPGNAGVVGFFHLDPEITPPTKQANQIHLFTADNTLLPNPKTAPASVLVRAIVETHALRLLYHTRKLGVRGVKRILVSGGASANQDLVRVLANVFGVAAWEIADPVVSGAAAAVGGVLRAAHALQCEAAGGVFVPFHPEVGVRVVAEPDEEAGKVYAKLMERFGTLEAEAVRLSI
ncbi:hypothetical protein BC830DRAFT_1120103 [Chytriomyces sp. MP71]|nr:hypothetical protein BC830DRAFT_1120103 [Chytriomyces sp. MP71]